MPQVTLDNRFPLLGICCEADCNLQQSISNGAQYSILPKWFCRCTENLDYDGAKVDQTQST